MDLTHIVYIIVTVVFVLTMTYMFVYNIRLKTRQRTFDLKGRQPMSREEGIAIATLEKERLHKTGSFW